MNKVKVYLAGGFHSDWQNQVIKECGTEDFYFLNPLEKETDDKTKKWKNIYLTEEEKEAKSKSMTQALYWYSDKLAVQKADIVFCYLEDYRPKLLGTGEIFELGMAFALGKFVILINKIEHRYYREYEHLFVSFKTLDKGIEYLKKQSWLK